MYLLHNQNVETYKSVLQLGKVLAKNKRAVPREICMERSKKGKHRLNPYYYLDHFLSKMPELMASKDKGQEYSDLKELEKLLPWSSDLPAKCRAQRR